MRHICFILFTMIPLIIGVIICSIISGILAHFVSPSMALVIACGISSFAIFIHAICEGGFLDGCYTWQTIMLLTLCQCVFWFDCNWFAWILLIIFAIWSISAPSWSDWGKDEIFFTLSLIQGAILSPYLGLLIVGINVTFSAFQGCCLFVLFLYSLYNIDKYTG